MEDTKSRDNYEKINYNYVKPWKHNKINLKEKMPLTRFEELELEDIVISTNADRIFDLVREGNFMYILNTKFFYFYFEVFFDKFNVLNYV